MRLSVDRLPVLGWHILIFVLLHITGNPFFIDDKYTVILIIIIAAIVCLGKREILKSSIYELFALSLPLLGTMLTNFDFDLSSYAHFCMAFLGAMLLSCAISIDDFSKYYINVMVFLAFISLVVWSVYLVQPQIANIFSSSMVPYEEDLRVYVNGAYLYTFLVPFGYKSGQVYSFNRNTSIFWEPGAYQYFLILAFILLLEKGKGKSELRNTIILIIALFTTGSTTGILCLILGVVIYRREIERIIPFGSDRNKKILFVVFLAIGAGFIVASELGASALGKLSDEGYDSLSRIGLSSLIEYINSWQFNLMFGMGTANQKAYGLYCDNTILYCFIVLGLVFMLTFLYLLYKSCKRNFVHYLGAFILIMLSFTSEEWILKFFVLYVIFARSYVSWTKTQLSEIY